MALSTLFGATDSPAGPARTPVRDAFEVPPGVVARFGGTANLDAFTDIRWVTMRGDITPYPF